MNPILRVLRQPMRIAAAAVLICSIWLISSAATASASNNEFITTWKTDQSSPNDSSISIPTAGSSNYDYTVYWGDGTSDSNVTGSITHNYAQPGTYTVSITGQFPRIFFNNNSQADKIISVDNWGSTAWDSMVDAFEGSSNLQINATDAPNLSQVNSLSGMFRYATAMDSAIGHWDLGSVTSIANIFEGATSFNQDLSGWDTSNVEMFAYAFNRATSFNQNINSWDMSSAVSTNAMFAFASSFDQPVNNWDTGNVRDMRDMFANATSFDQDVSSWDTKNVGRIESVFRNAVRFNQDISGWNYGSITDASFIFNGSRMTGTNYDLLLTTLAASTLRRGVVFDAGTSNYCFAGQARQQLVDSLGWTFLDSGQDVNSCGDTDIRFTEGLAATVNENESIGTVVGELITVHPNQSSSFNYSFCSANSTDATFFSISGNQLIAARSFDFENPIDANQDNVYELCIVSTDASSGFSLQRLLTVAVIDQVDPDVPNNDDSAGQVLSDSTSDPNNLDGGSVLAADSGESTTGDKVLATTGIAVSSIALIGVAISLSASYAHRKTVYVHKNSIND